MNKIKVTFSDTTRSETYIGLYVIDDGCLMIGDITRKIIIPLQNILTIEINDVV